MNRQWTAEVEGREMDENAIEVEAPDAATAAYIMSELVGLSGAELVAPAVGGGRWSVAVHPDGDGYEPLLLTINCVERALRRNDLYEACVRFHGRSYTIRNPSAIPPKAA